MNLKKLANIKNIVCLTAILAVGVGIFIANKDGSSDEAPVKKAASSSAASSKTESVSEEEDTREKVILAAEIPELKCGAVVMDTNVVFADPDGKYSFMKDGSKADSLTLQDDSGAEIKISNADGNLAITREDVSASGFVYEKHLIELKDGKLYYDASPVEYKTASFSSYRLDDNYVVECVEKGQYRIKDKDGKVLNECKIKENTDTTLKVTADENGFYSEGENDGFFYNFYRINGDILLTSWANILYVNGEELVPYGYDNKYSDPDVKADIDKADLKPMDPPEGNGAVSTANENISELTAEMLGYVNEYRAKYDMQPVYGLDELDAAAATRAEELAANFSHTRADNAEFNTVLTSAGIIWWNAGENIAKGGSSGREVFDSWISSKDHRAIMLDPTMKYLSFAKFEDGGNTYWELLMFNDSYVPENNAE